MDVIKLYCADTICNQIDMYMSVRDHNWYRWFDLDRRIHRGRDLPAYVSIDGDQMWYVKGKQHRLHDRPAVMLERSGFGGCHKNSGRQWYVNDLCHRDNDLPAIIWGDGTQEWYKNGKRHRDNDYPARVSRSCSIWYVNGIIHRDHGLPAVIQYDGTQIWYVHGKEVGSN